MIARQVAMLCIYLPCIIFFFVLLIVVAVSWEIINRIGKWMDIEYSLGYSLLRIECRHRWDIVYGNLFCTFVFFVKSKCKFLVKEKNRL